MFRAGGSSGPEILHRAKTTPAGYQSASDAPRMWIARKDLARSGKTDGERSGIVTSRVRLFPSEIYLSGERLRSLP